MSCAIWRDICRYNFGGEPTINKFPVNKTKISNSRERIASIGSDESSLYRTRKLIALYTEKDQKEYRHVKREKNGEDLPAIHLSVHLKIRAIDAGWSCDRNSPPSATNVSAILRSFPRRVSLTAEWRGRDARNHLPRASLFAAACGAALFRWKYSTCMYLRVERYKFVTCNRPSRRNIYIIE